MPHPGRQDFPIGTPGLRATSSGFRRIRGSGGPGAHGSDIVIVVDQRELKGLIDYFNLAPRKIRGFIKKRWGAQGRKAVAIMKRSHFSGPTGATSLRHRTSSQVTPFHIRGIVFKNTKRMRTMLGVKKIKFGRGGTFGGYMIIGFKGLLAEKHLTHPLINIFENYKGGERTTRSGASRGRLRTRGPLRAAWKQARSRVNLVKAVGDGIDDWIKLKT